MALHKRFTYSFTYLLTWGLEPLEVHWAAVPGVGDVVGEFKDAALTQQPGPQLDADDAEDEEDEEAQQQDVAEHRQRVEQQHHQYPQIYRHQQQSSTVRLRRGFLALHVYPVDV